VTLTTLRSGSLPRRGATPGRVTIVVIVGLGAVVVVPLGATTSAKSSGPKLTFTGAVQGKAKDIHQFCNESTGLDGDLLAGSGVALTGGPGVHVKGPFKCTQIDKL